MYKFSCINKVQYAATLHRYFSSSNVVFEKLVSIDPNSKRSYDFRGYLCDHLLHFQ